MNKKVVVLGGGTGMSYLLKGLKIFALDLTAIVSVCDDGRSTGRLRQEFNQPAVGDIRQVLVALSENEPLVRKLFNYRFDTTSDLNGHAVGNLLLTAMTNIEGSMSSGIESLSKILNLKGKVLPLTEDNVTLMAKMKDNTIIEGEHHITESKKEIKQIFYKEKFKVNERAINAIKEADVIVLSMGSIFTSIIPNLICKEIREAIDESKASILYTCNMMTQPGETDNFKASDHINLLNKYLGKKKIEAIIVNKEKISKRIKSKYEIKEQKDQVMYDKDNLKKLNLKVIADNLVTIDNGTIRHNSINLAFHIFDYANKKTN